MNVSEMLEVEKKEQNLLKDPKLLLYIINEIQKQIVGEEPTILTLILKINLRNVLNADPTSSNTLITEETGGGKDYIVKNICEVMLSPNDYYHRTDVSEKAFDYWKPKKTLNQQTKHTSIYDTWDRKVIHLEDPRPDLLKAQSFKVMASGGNIVTKVIDHKAKDITIEGKPVMLVTSLNTMIDLEGLRRWDALKLDTTPELTEKIINQKLQQNTGTTNIEPDQNLRHAIQHLIQPYHVIIPYAMQLKEYLPEHLMMRTQINKLLDYIKSSAVLHQHQRQKTKQNQLIANSYDYEYARYIYTHLKNEEGTPLNKDEENLIEILKTEDRPLSIREIAVRYNRHGKDWLYKHIDLWKNKGLIQETTDWDTIANKEITQIYLTPQYQSNGLPTAQVVFRSNATTIQPPTERLYGFIGFIAILRAITQKRKKQGLSTLFEENHYNQTKQQQTTDINGCIQNTIQPQYNQDNQKYIPVEEKEEHLRKTVNK